MDALLQDLRYALRSLAAKPGFAAAALLTLALGIGANTAIFSVIEGFFLKPLPYPHGERLVEVHNTYPKMGLEQAGTSIPDYLDRRSQAPALDDLAIYTSSSFNLASEGRPARLVGLRASPSLFTTLEVHAGLGRVFIDDDAVIGKEKVAVLTWGTWKDQFGADPAIVGRSVRLNGEPWTIIGVMPQGFGFPNRSVDLYVPFAFTDQERSDGERGNEFSSSIGRLKPGATVAQLDAQMDSIVAGNADRLAASSVPGAAGFAGFLRAGNFTGRSQLYHDFLVGNLRTTLIVLQAVVGFVLLIACANVANLLLTRVMSRGREFAIRTAIGADRWRLARQLLTETLLLSLGGTAVGVLFAVWCIDLIGWLGLDRSNLGFDVSLDPTVLGFSLVVAVVTGLVAGAIPMATVARVNANELIKEGGRGNTGGRGAAAVRNGLVVAELAMAVTLLVGAGLLIKSFAKLAGESPGFQADGVVTAMIALPRSKFPSDPPADAKALDPRTAFIDRMLERMRALPGVQSVGVTTVLPFSNQGSQSSYGIVGYTPPEGTPGPHGHIRFVDEDYFKTMQIPVLAGRGFSRTLDQPEPQPAQDAAGNVVDAEHAAPVAVVIDKRLAERYFKDKDPIGQRIINGFVGEIVGVVDTVKNNRLDDDSTKETYYWYYRQRPMNGMALVVRTTLDPATISSQLRETILSIDPEQPVFDIKTMDARVSDSLATRRAPMYLLLLFAGVAIALAAIGVYGVLAYSVSQRTSEIGVRVALGASRRQVFGLVIGQGMRLIAGGIVLGLVAAFALGRFLQSLLFGVAPTDPLILAIVALALAAVALVACWLPARRATAIDPIEALHYE